MDQKIGILGCQSKHAEFFASLFNLEGCFPGYEVAYILGDDEPGRLPYVLETAHIPIVCHDVDELIEKSAAVLITYRQSERHFKTALACLKQGKAVFVDKPFTHEAYQAVDLVAASLQSQVLLMGGSTLCFDPQITLNRNETHASAFGSILYQADQSSPFGGYRFYGSHLTDLCASVFGTDASSANAICHDDAVTTFVRYPSRTVTLHSQIEYEKPQVSYTAHSTLQTLTLDDTRCYLNGMKAFIEGIENGVPDQAHLERLVFSVSLLDTIMRSLSEGGEKQISPI